MYIATCSGVDLVAFVLDTLARCNVGWRVAKPRKAETETRSPAAKALACKEKERLGLIHHSDLGSRYLSIRYTEQYLTCLNHYRSTWKDLDALEFTTLEWVNWFIYRRLLRPIGNVPAVKYEMAYYRHLEEADEAA